MAWLAEWTGMPAFRDRRAGRDIYMKDWNSREEAKRIRGRGKTCAHGVKDNSNISGADASRGNTRSHPEHDG